MTTNVTAAQIAQVRRMVAEPTTATYSDALITTYIETYPVIDERGQMPYTFTATIPPTQDPNLEWIPTYDLNAAAADIWQEKAATFAGLYDFSADGGNYSRSQVYEQMMKQARFYRARRRPASAMMVKYPDEAANETLWIGNLPEPD